MNYKLLHILNDVNTIPDIIFIQERKLRINKIFRNKNYKVYRKDRPSSHPTDGGVATFIKFNIRHTITSIFSDVFALKITLHLDNLDIDIINITHPKN